jgi:hypothetical protein
MNEMITHAPKGENSIISDQTSSPSHRQRTQPYKRIESGPVTWRLVAHLPTATIGYPANPGIFQHSSPHAGCGSD